MQETLLVYSQPDRNQKLLWSGETTSITLFDTIRDDILV